MDKDAEFLTKLLATFKVEAREHLQGISSGLISLEVEDNPEQQAEIVEVVFRETHSLKGAARAVNLTEIESLCQAMESIFATMKKKATKPAAELFDLLQEGVDYLGRILPSAEAKRTAEEKSLQLDLIRRLKKLESGEQGARSEERGTGNGVRGKPRTSILEPRTSAFQPRTSILDPQPSNLDPRTSILSLRTSILEPRSTTPVIEETVRVSTLKLSSMLLQSEEMLSAKLAVTQRALEMKTIHSSFGLWKKEGGKILPIIQEIRAAIRNEQGGIGSLNGMKQRSLTKLLDFIDWNSSFVKSLEERCGAEKKAAERDSRTLGGMVNTLLDDMKMVLMFPFASLLEILPKIVRDLSRDSGKDIGLTVRGEEIEIDRRILEEMKDPLVHLVRNCIDHGIEPPEERLQKNKPRQGMISVTVAPRDNKVEVEVADDGAGINPVALRSVLQKSGMVSREKGDELTDRELLDYVFQSGISTSPIITELSGRGLGLAIVREKVEKLGGTIALESFPDAGCRFRIVLPLTVATFRGITVRSGERLFVLPTMHVERVLSFSRNEIRTVENRETIHLDGKAVSLARLAGVLGLPPGRSADSRDTEQGVVLTAGGARIAFLVDEVLGEQEVLLKSLGSQLRRVRNIDGATVFGNGQAVPIINVPDLLKSAVRGTPPQPVTVATASGEGPRRSVLVVEDSITTRTLLRSILQGAGYDVATAVDGVDAYTRLKSETFDIVVSDVDMPRMNGFDLTARIRADRGLAELPVVLVTALASREDQERGIDVGANAYIVKSSFDQSNLLEVLERLI